MMKSLIWERTSGLVIAPPYVGRELSSGSYELLKKQNCSLLIGGIQHMHIQGGKSSFWAILASHCFWTFIFIYRCHSIKLADMFELQQS